MKTKLTIICVYLQKMGRLKNEIMQFLTEMGFHCTDEVPEGSCADVIRVTEPERLILPLEISAATQEEAETHARAVLQKIGNLKYMTGESPVIIPEDRWRSRSEMKTSGASGKAFSDICTQLRSPEDREIRGCRLPEQQPQLWRCSMPLSLWSFS